jgi:hypothetical protein
MRACFPFDHSISLDVALAVSSLYKPFVFGDVFKVSCCNLTNSIVSVQLQPFRAREVAAFTCIRALIQERLCAHASFAGHGAGTGHVTGLRVDWVSVLSVGNKAKVDAECDFACNYYFSFTQRSLSFAMAASLTFAGRSQRSSSGQCSATASTTSSPK